LWHIDPLYANTITLSFNLFDTENGVDILRIFDGNTQVGEFSGNVIPDPITATSGSMFIAWFTNDNNNFQGWNIYYEVDNIGIPDNSCVHSLNIYPNPASDRLNVLFESETDETIDIRLVSLTGQVFLKEVVEGSAGNYHAMLDVKDCPGGIYFLELVSPSSKLVRKVMIR
jgi:hypothetical protein